MSTPARLNPRREKGIPLERQYRSWKQIVKDPYRKQEVDAYSRARVILMNGIEAEAGLYSHSFARMTDNLEIKALLARTRQARTSSKPRSTGSIPATRPSWRPPSATSRSPSI
jgi:hypothetical protein